MSRIDELKAKLEAAKLEAASKALTADELAESALLSQIATEKETAAGAEKTRRANALAARIESARAKAGRAYLVAGVDVVALFPPGAAPPAEQLPSGGAIVVRSPSPELVAWIAREVEAKAMGVHAMAAEIVAKATVDPDPAGTDGVTLGSFCEAYPEAALQIAGKIREQGGAKAQAEAKRGQ